MPAPATTETVTPVWTNSKAAVAGTWVADAIKGRSANGPTDFRQVTENNTEGSTRKLWFADGTVRTMGVATKLFVATTKPTSKVEVIPDPKPSAKERAAKVQAEGATVPARPPATPVLEQIEEAAQGAAESRLERLRLAKLEHATLQVWIKDGEKPPRPATPNLDAINADNTPTGRKVQPVTPKAPKAPRVTKAKPAAGDGADAGTRAPQGSFQQRVVAWVVAHPDPEGVAPSAVDKALGSRNASNALQAAAKTGKVTLVSEKPRRYSAVA